MLEPADLDFLDEMKLQATLHAECLHSKNHWPKPFYSDVNLFVPGVRRVFVGVNSKGDKCSHEYDKKQENEQRVWSGNKPLHNAYLDECWGNCEKSPAPRGRSHLQIAAQEVFKGMYGPKWKHRLRNTPCFNLIPVSSNGTTDPALDNIWDNGVDWSIELLEHLSPKFIILYGNGKSGKSVWAALNEKYGLDEISKDIHFAEGKDYWKYLLKQHRINKGTMKGVKVLSFPHLSYIQDYLHNLERKLINLRPFP